MVILLIGAGIIDVAANLIKTSSSAVLLNTQKILLHIYLNDLNLYVLIATFLVSAHPHVNVISGGP